MNRNIIFFSQSGVFTLRIFKNFKSLRELRDFIIHLEGVWRNSLCLITYKTEMKIQDELSVHRFFCVSVFQIQLWLLLYNFYSFKRFNSPKTFSNPSSSVMICEHSLIDSNKYEKINYKALHEIVKVNSTCTHLRFFIQSFLICCEISRKCKVKSFHFLK